MSSFGDFIALSDICDVATAKIISREVSDGSRSFQASRGTHFRCSLCVGEWPILPGRLLLGHLCNPLIWSAEFTPVFLIYFFFPLPINTWLGAGACEIAELAMLLSTRWLQASGKEPWLGCQVKDWNADGQPLAQGRNLETGCYLPLMCRLSHFPACAFSLESQNLSYLEQPDLVGGVLVPNRRMEWGVFFQTKPVISWCQTNGRACSAGLWG